MTQDDKALSPCACLGPRNSEPYCNCQMVQRGLVRSTFHIEEQARFERNIKEALPKLFGWSAHGRAGG